MATLPISAIAGVLVPLTPLTTKAFAYVQKHTTPTIANHVIRSTLFALIIASKISTIAQSYDPETVALATLLHDLGWSTTSELVSSDERFEVDGANAACNFLKTEIASNLGLANRWDKHRLQLVWDAIALHTTASTRVLRDGTHRVLKYSTPDRVP